MSPDLKVATAFVLPLGGKDADAVVEALDRIESFSAAGSRGAAD